MSGCAIGCSYFRIGCWGLGGNHHHHSTGADASIENHSGHTAAAYCHNDQCRDLLLQHEKLVLSLLLSHLSSSFERSFFVVVIIIIVVIAYFSYACIICRYVCIVSLCLYRFIILGPYNHCMLGFRYTLIRSFNKEAITSHYISHYTSLKFSLMVSLEGSIKVSFIIIIRTCFD